MTIIGYIVLALGFVALFVSKKWLYRLFVFTTLFSATSAANVGEGKDASALQVWMVFGVFWLIRLIIEQQLSFSFAIDPRIARGCKWLAAFLLIAALSLLMPVYINGALSITSPFLFDGSKEPLFLTSHNLTQFLYLAFGCAITVSVATYNMLDKIRHETERVILCAALFAGLWGLLQFVCAVTGTAYPAYIFNNSASVSGKGFLETIDGIGRISSVGVEPSIFAQSLLSLLPLTLPAWLGKGVVFSVKIDRFCAILFLTVLILSTSSTAYIGIAMLLVLCVVALLRTGTITITRALKRIALLTTVALGGIIVAASSVPVVRGVITSALLQKGVSGSALERLMTIALAFGYFKKFPLLGIGWGSATSHDLIVKLLSNVGIAGALAFLGAMYGILRDNWRALGQLVDHRSLSRLAWFLGLTIYLLTSVILGFPLAFGNFWLILGMAISTSWQPNSAPAVSRFAAVSNRSPQVSMPHGLH